MMQQKSTFRSIQEILYLICQSVLSVINPNKNALYMYCLVILYFLSDSVAGIYGERERDFLVIIVVKMWHFHLH